MTSLLETFQYNLQEKIGELKMPISIWGNGAVEGIRFNYDFFETESSFNAMVESESQPAEILLIVGPVNKKQLIRIQERISRPQRKKPFVIYAQGMIPYRLMKLSDKVVADIPSQIHVDYEYQQFPLDLKDLIKAITGVVKGGHEK